MREIEVKARIKSIRAIKQSLRMRGFRFSQTVLQEDRIFLKEGVLFSEITAGTSVIRLRKQGRRDILTLKQSVSNELDCIEREVVVNDGEKMADILKMMDYREVLRVKKRRTCAKSDSFTVNLDTVEGLGSFIEVEIILSEEESGTKVQNELFEFLSQLGVTQESRVNIGYDTMLFNMRDLKC